MTSASSSSLLNNALCVSMTRPQAMNDCGQDEPMIRPWSSAGRPASLPLTTRIKSSWKGRAGVRWIAYLLGGICLLYIFFSPSPASWYDAVAKGVGSVDLVRGERLLPGLAPHLQDDVSMTSAACKSQFPLFSPQIEENHAAWTRKGGITAKHLEDSIESCHLGCVRLVVQDGMVFIRNHT